MSPLNICCVQALKQRILQQFRLKNNLLLAETSIGNVFPKYHILGRYLVLSLLVELVNVFWYFNSWLFPLYICNNRNFQKTKLCLKKNFKSNFAGNVWPAASLSRGDSKREVLENEEMDLYNSP